MSPQLKNADTPRNRPVITTHNHDNHGIVSNDWRYIIYADGSQELYQRKTDPHEWTNLADDPKYAAVIAEHRRWIPKTNRPPAPGSRSRILTYKNGEIVWEGKQIDRQVPVPGL